MAYFAIALDGNNAFAHSCLSFALFGRGDHRGALAEAHITHRPRRFSKLWYWFWALAVGFPNAGAAGDLRVRDLLWRLWRDCLDSLATSGTAARRGTGRCGRNRGRPFWWPIPARATTLC